MVEDYTPPSDNPVLEDPNTKLGKTPNAPHPPGFKHGMDWNSEDAKRAYAAQGKTFDEARAEK